MENLRPEMLNPEFLLEHIRRDTKFDADLLEKIISEWKRYKATGLEPEEIAKLQLAYEAMPKGVTTSVVYDTCFGVPLEKIKKLLSAEKDGRLWMSPVPLVARTKLYCPRKTDVQEQTLQYITLLDGEPTVSVSFECDYECDGCPHNAPYTNYDAGDGGCDGEGGFGLFNVSDVGKTVFLTREEAEAALRGEEHE